MRERESGRAENWKSATSKERKGGVKEESWAIKKVIETGISLLLRLARGGLWSLYIRWWPLGTQGGNAILGEATHIEHHPAKNGREESCVRLSVSPFAGCR